MNELTILFSALFWIGIAITLIYLLIRRIRIRETENFEKRDN